MRHSNSWNVGCHLLVTGLNCFGSPAWTSWRLTSKLSRKPDTSDLLYHQVRLPSRKPTFLIVERKPQFETIPEKLLMSSKHFLLCLLCRWCEPRSSGSDGLARRMPSLASRPWVELTHQFSGLQSYWWKNDKDHELAIVVPATTVLRDLLSWAHLWRTFLGLSQKRHTFQQ